MKYFPDNLFDVKLTLRGYLISMGAATGGDMPPPPL